MSKNHKNEKKNEFDKEAYGISKKYDREKYEKITVREKEKLFNKDFGDKKTIKDRYNQQIIHRDDKKAENKYGSNKNELNYTYSAMHKKSSDHIIPLKHAHDINKYNPFLKDSDITRIYDNESNRITINKSLNSRKGDKTNLEFVFGKDRNGNKYASDIPIDGKVNMVSDHIVSSINTNTKVVATTVKNVREIALAGAKAELAANAQNIGILTAKGMYGVLNDEKSVTELATDVTIQVSNVAVSGTKKYVIQVATEKPKELAVKTTKNLVKKNKMLTKITNNNTVIKTAETIINVKDSLFRYVNEDLTEAELIEDIAKTAILAKISVVSYLAGEAVPIPIPLVGGAVVSMISTIVCEFIFELYDSVKSINSYKSHISKINKLADQATREMEHQRQVLLGMSKEYFDEFDSNTEKSFNMVFEAIQMNDVNKFADGIDNLLVFFGQNVKFSNYDEFDEFFMNENNTLKF